MKICLNLLDSNSDGISIFNIPSVSILADISPPQKTKAWSGSKCLYNSLVISLQEEKSHKGFVIKKVCFNTGYIITLCCSGKSNIRQTSHTSVCNNTMTHTLRDTHIKMSEAPLTQSDSVLFVQGGRFPFFLTVAFYQNRNLCCMLGYLLWFPLVIETQWFFHFF